MKSKLRESRPALMAFTYMCVFVMLWIDYITGSIIISEAYVPLIVFATWYYGDVHGFLIALISSVGWALTNYHASLATDAPTVYTSRVAWMTFVFLTSAFATALIKASEKRKSTEFVEIEAKLKKLKADSREGDLGQLRAMVMMIDGKDSYTGVHSQRVQHMSIKIAKALGLDEYRIEQIGHASWVHDIGKINIPVEILQKESTLTHDEMMEIKTHPYKAAAILQGIPSLRNLAEAVMYHHVWYNGRGYPNTGLRNSLIPIEARIIAVADAIDAMMHSRPYRCRLTVDEVMYELREGSGTQFDPNIVNLFLEGKVEIQN